MEPVLLATGSASVVDSARAAATALVGVLAARGLRVVTAESFTGGLASYLLVDVPDSGPVAAGSVVAYATDEKRRILEVDDCPVVSGECASRMAVGAARLFRVPCAVSFTGVAGPSTQEGRPVGTAFIGVHADERTAVLQRRYDGSPDTIRLAAIADAFRALSALLER